MHSTASDGTMAPAEVVRLAAQSGLQAIALTDHDTVAGVPDAVAAGRELAVEVIAGCEFSVAAPWGEAHLLGYLMPLDVPELLSTLGEMRRARGDRAVAIVAAINGCGIALDLPDVEREAAGAPIGRPHVARALIQRKAVRGIEEAFDRFLGRGRPGYVAKRLPPFEEITSLIRRIGGVSSLAHPKDRVARDGWLVLRDQGLDAIEVRHPSHRPAVRAGLERLADELGFLKTGGSDAHGTAAASPSHSVVGGERVPMEWVDRMQALAALRG